MFVNSGATEIVLVILPSTAVESEQLRSAQVAGQWRGDTALTLPLPWRRSTVSPVFFWRFPRSSLSLSRPLPTLSPSLIGHLASVDVKQHESAGFTAGLPNSIPTVGEEIMYLSLHCHHRISDSCRQYLIKRMGSDYDDAKPASQVQ